MNWFQCCDANGFQVLLQEVVDISAAPKSQTKLAHTSRSHDVDYAVYANNDGYAGKVQLVENNNKIVLTARILNSVYHFPLLEEQWHYMPQEKRRSIKTFNRVVNILEDIKVEIEAEEMPGPTLQGLMREELRFIDIDRKKGSSNRSLEAAKFIPGESDWRSSLYGNRYPTPPITITNHGDIYLS